MLALIVISVILGVIAFVVTIAVLGENMEGRLTGKDVLLTLIIVWTAFTVFAGMTYVRYKKMEARQHWESTR